MAKRSEHRPGAPFTVAEAAAELGLSAESVRRMIRARQLPAYRDGPSGGRWMVPERAVLERRERKAAAAELAAAPLVIATRSHYRPPGRVKAK